MLVFGTLVAECCLQCDEWLIGVLTWTGEGFWRSAWEVHWRCGYLRGNFICEGCGTDASSTGQ